MSYNNYNNINNFFLVDNKYYIYIYNTYNNYKFIFEILDNNLYIFIQNKNTKINESFKLKIMYENKEIIININNLKLNSFNIGNINNIKFENSVLLNNSINVNDYYLYEIFKDENNIFEYEINKETLIIKPIFIKNETKLIKLLLFDKFFSKKIHITVDINSKIIKEIFNIDKLFNNNDLISINNYSLEENFNIIYPNFDLDYYTYNNNYISTENKNNKKLIYYHMHYCGKYNSQIYFKYLLLKYKDIILNLDYPKLKYDSNKKNTLLFIDDRYDCSFIYVLILFLYSINDLWNITIITIKENKEKYEYDLNKLGIDAKFIILDKKFNNINDYSELLKKYTFWESITEENCLLFQYDSFCMGKFNNDFFTYNYIGAPWDHCPSILKKFKIGNGGTSFRKTRIMEYLCKKYEKKYIKKDYPEDLFFCELLSEEFLHNCTEEIANKFSFENIFNENSIYGHQIYKSIKFEDLDLFIFNKLSKL
jgi:hypothetical protein